MFNLIKSIKFNKVNQTNFTSSIMLICFLAFGSFFLTINLPLVGEEGVYTNAAIEMIFNKKYKFATLFGNTYPRPPLYNWLIILFSKIFGANNVVLSARLVTITATFIMAGTLFYLTKILTFTSKRNNEPLNNCKPFAWLTIAIFLSGDLLFKRGWLAYSDPVFAMFIFASMALLIVSTLNNNFLLMVIVNSCLFLGFLSKTHTAYIFYATTYLILLFAGYRKFLLSFKNILLHLGFMALPMIWDYYANNSYFLLTTIADIKRVTGINHNHEVSLWHNILIFPLQTWLALLPGSLICFFHIKYRNDYSFIKANDHTILSKPIVIIVLSISFINFIPYWITSQSNIRYLLPIYPWVALSMSYFIWQKKLIKPCVILLCLSIILKYLAATIWFPYEYKVKHGNAEQIAQEIIQKTLDKPLYIQSYAAAGLRIGGAINKLRWPNQPLQEKPEVDNNYFILTENLMSNDSQYQLIKTFLLKKEKIYLYLVSYQE